MSVRTATAVLLLLAGAVAISYSASRLHRGPASRSIAAGGSPGGAPGTSEYLRARLRARAYPFYRALFARRVVRSAAAPPDGTLRLAVDLHAAAHPFLIRAGLEGLDDLLPDGAIVEVRETASGVSETWRFSCPDGCVLDAFSVEGAELAPSGAASALAGTPEAVAAFRLAPERFRDFAVGLHAQRLLRERVSLIEAILGRPVRTPAAEDLSGTGSAAFYADPAGGRGRVLVALDLARTDRLRGLLDVVLGLGALTRGAEVHRHRNVAIGAVARGPSGVAAAVDGNLLLLATDPTQIEAAIDRRRGEAEGALPRPPPRLGRAGLRIQGGDGLDATLTREADGWRLESEGPACLADDRILTAWTRSGWFRSDATEPPPSADREP